MRSYGRGARPICSSVALTDSAKSRPESISVPSRSKTSARTPAKRFGLVTFIQFPEFIPNNYLNRKRRLPRPLGGHPQLRLVRWPGPAKISFLCQAPGRARRSHMADIFPFRAYRYNPLRAQPADVLTQPYDKITPAMQQCYLRSSPYN